MSTLMMDHQDAVLTPTPLKRSQMTIIEYPLFQEIDKKINRCKELSKVSGEPQCMCLTGETGAGKSTLIKRYASRFPRRETEDGTEIPVFYFETPSPVTEKGMASTMLEALGDPAPFKGTQWQMDSRLRHFIKACQVELVILDDFQHLIDKRRNRVLLSVSEWLKATIKRADIPFLVVGIEGQVEPILRCNSQLSRLFACRERLRPFAWNTKDMKTIENFARFVGIAETSIGISLPEDIPRTELLYRLHYASNGVVGNLMNLLREASLTAREQGRRRLDLVTLSVAFSNRLAEHLPDKVNPFDAAPDVMFVPPKKKTNQSVAYNGETPSQVLTTR